MKVVCFLGTGSRGSVKVDNLEAQGGPGVRKLIFFLAQGVAGMQS